MNKITINYKGKQIDIERLPNGKFKRPDFLKEAKGLYSPGLKPAVEVVIVVQKKISENTYAEQFLKNGKGSLDLDSCRIPYKDENIDFEKGNPGQVGFGAVDHTWNKDPGDYEYKHSQNGRFPANLLISDDVLDDGPIQIGDSGGFSRFFSLDAWAEKNLNIKEIEKWETKIVEEINGLRKQNIIVNIVQKNLKIIKVIEEIINIISAQIVVLQNLDLKNHYQYVKFVEKMLNHIETFIVQDLVVTRIDMDNLISQIKELENKVMHHITQSNQIQLHQEDVKYVGHMIKNLKDTIQIIQRKLISSGYAEDVIGKRSKHIQQEDIQCLNYDTLPKNIQSCLPFIPQSKASKKEKNAGVEQSKDDRWFPEYWAEYCTICNKRGDSCKCKEPVYEKRSKKIQPNNNNHPTVKPIKLMSYLITMGSRPGDVILDPFAGSGTTGCSAIMLDRNYILIEQEEEYIEIIKSRIDYYHKLKNQETIKF